MATVALDKIGKMYGDLAVVKDVNLEIGDGEFVTILGASGSGKTTCLRMVAGFVQPTSGRILIGGRDMTGIPAHRRNAGMVFQQYALFPHYTVAQNVAFGLKIRKLPKAEVKQRTMEALKLVRLDELAERYPAQLSGGQKQRVALARAIVIKPEILLLDEPLAALDLKLREELQVEIKNIQKNLGVTTLFVTHDQKEALSMSDRVVVMHQGEILQVDTPTALYRRPKNRYVANFVGRTNLFKAALRSCDASGQTHELELADMPGRNIRAAGKQVNEFAPGEPCLVGFRPEDAVLGDRHSNRLNVSVRASSYIGNGWLLECQAPALGAELIYVLLPSGVETPAANANIVVSWPDDLSILLKAGTRTQDGTAPPAA